MKSKDIGEKYEEYESHATDNELELLRSDRCVCTACGGVFSARDVKSWGTTEDGALSAVCPICGLMHVVGDASGLEISEKIGLELHQYQKDTFGPELSAKEYTNFCTMYTSGRLDASPRNAGLYLIYLQWLTDEYEDPRACLDLARLYHQGSEYMEPNLEKSIEYYKKPLLAYDHRALYELGLIYDNRDEKGDGRRAFECFSKSAALGSTLGSLAIANFYMRGRFVAQDPLYGANAILSVFGELYERAFIDVDNLPEFATAAYNLGLCFRHGVGVKKSDFRALRYYLIALFAAEFMDLNKLGHLNWKDDVQQIVDDLVRDTPPGSGTVVYDEDTFYDSFYEQQDGYSDKRIVSVEYSEDSSALYVEIEYSRPQLIIDCGNAQIDLVKTAKWKFPNAKFEEDPEERSFERIEFVDECTVNFVFSDPLYGDRVALKLIFPPAPPETKEEEE